VDILALNKDCAVYAVLMAWGGCVDKRNSGRKLTDPGGLHELSRKEFRYGKSGSGLIITVAFESGVRHSAATNRLVGMMLGFAKILQYK